MAGRSVRGDIRKLVSSPGDAGLRRLNPKGGSSTGSRWRHRIGSVSDPEPGLKPESRAQINLRGVFQLHRVDSGQRQTGADSP